MHLNARAPLLSYFSHSQSVQCGWFWSYLNDRRCNRWLKKWPMQIFKTQICPPLPIHISSSNNPAGPDLNQNFDLTWPDVFLMSPCTLGTRLCMRMCANLENGILRIGQQPKSVVNDQGECEAMKMLSGRRAPHCDYKHCSLLRTKTDHEETMLKSQWEFQDIIVERLKAERRKEKNCTFATTHSCV